MHTLREQNADLRRRMRSVQQAFLDADVRAETCEKEVEQLNQQKISLEDKIHRLEGELQSLKEEVDRFIRTWYLLPDVTV